MALPRIDSDPTAVDRLPGARPITPATSIGEARAHLHTTGEAAAVVFQHGRPVGVVSAAALANAVALNGHDAPVCAAMDYVAVPVDRDAGAQQTVRTFTGAAWDWLKRRPPRRP